MRLETKEIKTKSFMRSQDAKDELIKLIDITMDEAVMNGYWRKKPDLFLEYEGRDLKYIGKALILFTRAALPASQMVIFGWENNIKTFS